MFPDSNSITKTFGKVNSDKCGLPYVFDPEHSNAQQRAEILFRISKSPLKYEFHLVVWSQDIDGFIAFLDTLECVLKSYDDINVSIHAEKEEALKLCVTKLMKAFGKRLFRNSKAAL